MTTTEPQFNWFVVNTITEGHYNINVNGTQDKWSARVVKRGVHGKDSSPDGKEATANGQPDIFTSYLKLVSREDGTRRPVKALVICYSSIYHITFWPGKEVKIPSAFEYGTRIAYGSGGYTKGFEYKIKGLFLSKGMSLTSFQAGNSQVAWDLNVKDDGTFLVNMKPLNRSGDRKDGSGEDHSEKKKLHLMYFHPEKNSAVHEVEVFPGDLANVTPPGMGPTWPHLHLMYFEKTRRPYFFRQRSNYYVKSHRPRSYSSNSANFNSRRSDGNDSPATASTGDSTKNDSV